MLPTRRCDNHKCDTIYQPHHIQQKYCHFCQTARDLRYLGGSKVTYTTICTGCGTKITPLKKSYLYCADCLNNKMAKLHKYFWRGSDCEYCDRETVIWTPYSKVRCLGCLESVRLDEATRASTGRSALALLADQLQSSAMVTPDEVLALFPEEDYYEPTPRTPELH